MSEYMSDFEKRWGNLTVGEALELNKKAKETCEFETTSECDTIE
jgi:hypothetical protein